MKTKNFKRSMCVALASTFTLAAVAPSVSFAQERQTLAAEPMNLKGMGDDARSLLDTQQFVIKALSGVDIGDLPVLEHLFPKKESIDYERIAREVSRAIKEAFVENNIFDQQSKLEATVTGLSRHVKTGDITDANLVDRLNRLDDILARTEKTDIRLRAIGYYASAAQVSLGAMALRRTLRPESAGLKLDIWDSLREYRKKVIIAAQELRGVEVQRISNEDYSPCFPYMGAGFALNDIKEGKLTLYKSLALCQAERTDRIDKKAQLPEFLVSLYNSWKDAEMALLGGDEGLKAYKAVTNPETAKKLNLPAYVTAYMASSVIQLTEPVYYKEHVGSVCNAIGAAIINGQFETRFPAGNVPRESLLRAANCPANSGSH